MTSQIKVEGMSCHHCVMAIQKELNKLNAKDFKVEIGLVEINLETNNLQLEKIKEAIERAGYKVIE
ncbi:MULTISPECIES: cation transporter [Ignavibacterium]|jgi:copper chaperone|uniref:heavy-metal-associated domain-containing protein n=1 Tax=Ignavibacterium TaxID=795750 RepID=UPI0025B98302|nr:MULTISPECIES: cation transporter [Ignavibacterium]MBI5661373.1 heavy-metal-associated domain-containing protein [Ignavibacterium album]